MSAPDTLAAIAADLTALAERLAVVTSAAEAVEIVREATECQYRLGVLDEVRERERRLDPRDWRHS